ncbi:MAG: D-alanyl-D-alanine carboxypeptidase family protein [Ruminococcus sp.]
MRKDNNMRKSMRRARIVTETAISAVIIGLGGYGIYTAVSRTSDVGSAPVEDVSDVSLIVTEPVIETPDPNAVIYENVPYSTKDKFRGDLILVNNQHEYLGGNEDLISINEANDHLDSETYIIGNDYDMKIQRRIYAPLVSMTRDFNTATGYDDLVVIGGFRTTEKQQELYDADLESTGNATSTRVALPGHSEHESGYAMDFTTSTTWDYDGTGEYDWINKNCWKYGFILRYPENKTEITEIQYEAWHYRYVGVPHAYYMYTNNLCFEEYIDLIREHPYSGEHLSFTDGNSVEYEVYFVSSDDGSEQTYVPVPTGKKYEISGNNIDGFIVTVYCGEDVEQTAEKPTVYGSESSGDSSDDNSSAESTDEGNDDNSGESTDNGSSDESSDEISESE